MGDSEGSKKRLRPWLQGRISSGEIPGLYWTDPEKKTFHISWRHGGKQGWSEEDGRIFMEWAVHTGRFRPGVDQVDYVTWKTRLRCALNKAPDIQEVKIDGSIDGPDPYRVYKFIDNPKKTAKRPTNTNTNGAGAGTDESNDASYQTGANIIPTFVDDQVNSGDQPMPSGGKLLSDMTCGTKEDNLPSDLNTITRQDLMQAFDPTDTNISMTSLLESLQEFVKAEPAPNDTQSVAATNIVQREDWQMHLSLYYCNKIVMQQWLEQPSGCRLQYSTGETPILVNCPQWLNDSVYGTNQSQVIFMPPCDGLVQSRHEKTLQKALEIGMTGGIMIGCFNNDIYVLRLSRCTIFYATQFGTGGEPVKLDRDKDIQCMSSVKVFDFENQFLPALNEYVAGARPRPDPRLYLMFGTQQRISGIDENVLMHATIVSQLAIRALEFANAQIASKTPYLQMSASNEYDAKAKEVIIKQEEQENDVLAQLCKETLLVEPGTSYVSQRTMYTEEQVQQLLDQAVNAMQAQLLAQVEAVTTGSATLVGSQSSTLSTVSWQQTNPAGSSSSSSAVYATVHSPDMASTYTVLQPPGEYTYHIPDNCGDNAFPAGNPALYVDPTLYAPVQSPADWSTQQTWDNYTAEPAQEEWNPLALQDLAPIKNDDDLIDVILCGEDVNSTLTFGDTLSGLDLLGGDALK